MLEFYHIIIIVIIIINIFINRVLLNDLDFPEKLQRRPLSKVMTLRFVLCPIYFAALMKIGLIQI